MGGLAFAARRAASRGGFKAPSGPGAALLLLLLFPSPAPSQSGEGRSAELEKVLYRLAERADVYERTALRFACVEAVTETRYDAQEGIKKQSSESHDYLLEYTERDGLQPYRAILSRNGRETRRQQVDPGYEVPEPYGWNLLFTEERQGRFKFRLVDKEIVEPYLAWVIEFRPLLAFVDGKEIDQWEGKVWVDQDTLDVIRVEAIPGLQSETLPAQLQEYREAFRMFVSWKKRPKTRKLEVEFGTQREGLRFPSRSFSSIRLVNPQGEVEQLTHTLAQVYRDYIFFDTDTLEKFEERRSASR